MPVLNALAPLLAILAVALPFLFAWTQPPMSGFWPLAASAGCALVLAALAWLRCWRGLPPRPGWLGACLGAGLVLAAGVGAAIGLVQFFQGDVGLAPWVYPSTPGQALGNLRQRNQQASLMAMGLWALLWLVGQMQAHVSGRHSPVWTPLLARGGREWPLGLAGLLTPWVLVLIAVSGAATASRTGALEWGVIAALLLLWRRSFGGLALALAAVGALVYVAAAWQLPELLHQWTGFRVEGLFTRLADPSHRCTSRTVLWSNMLHLIAQRPWTGWGWGETDFAHYVTLFPGERFCVLLDNAHNLPLHLAVELGLPVALGLCLLAAVAVARARPWAERDPVRQLAWGLLAIVGVHSLLEFPLWYGPFQLATALAVALLWRGGPPRWLPRRAALGAAAVAGAAALALGLWLAADYVRVSQLYRPLPERLPAYRADTPEQAAAQLRFFRAPAEFALLTTTPVNAGNAERMHALALRLLHYSPEPRVIEPLLESARLLGREEEAAFHRERYRIAYPADYARWARAPVP